MIDIDQANQLEREAEHNNGKCSHCNQTIKIYRYKINKTHAAFLKAMATAVRESGVNDVDISTIGMSYSVRSQVTKMRMHGLIARVQDARKVQLPRRWLITHKGWDFLNGGEIPSKVVVFDNTVLGHDGVMQSIYEVLGEMFDPEEPIYVETPVSEPEARVLSEVRQPRKLMQINATFRGRDYQGKFRKSQVYELMVKHLQVGKPVEVISIDGEPHERNYKDLAAFQREWKAA